MPQGDGTGPVGGGGRGRGVGQGMGRGCGQGPGQGRGRHRRQDAPGGVGKRDLGPPDDPAANSGPEVDVSETVPVPAVTAGHRSANEEAVEVEPQTKRTTPLALVDEEACTPCGACHAACPVEAIRLGDNSVRVLAEVCCGCGACVDVCPAGAIRLV